MDRPDVSVTPWPAKPVARETIPSLSEREATWLRQLEERVQVALRDRNLFIESLFFIADVDKAAWAFNCDTMAFVAREEERKA